ncbi:MAG: hypothetical protein ABI387_15650 [Lacunisphaera sp.]
MKDIGFFAVVVLFRCIAVLLFGTAAFSLAGALFSFPSQSIQLLGAMLWRVEITYVVAAAVVWVASKPIAAVIVSGIALNSPDGKYDVFKSSMRD